MSAVVNSVETLRGLLAEFNAEGDMFIRRERLAEIWESRDLGEPRRLTEAIKNLRRRGELKSEEGGLRYYPQPKPEPGYARIYRALRASAGPLSLDELSRLAECQIKRTGKAIRSLAASGYIAEAGRVKSGQRLWLATARCRNQPEPPALDYSDVDFALERRAVSRLVEVLMVGDPKRASAIQAIREQLNVLNRRFGGEGGE